MNDLTITRNFNGTRLDALKGEWQALFDAAHQPTPFLSWEWLSTFRRVLAMNEGSLVLEVRDRARRLVGALALSSLPWRGGRRWQLLGNGLLGCDGLDVLALPDRASEVLRLVAEALVGCMSDRWDTLDLEDLPCGAPIVGVLCEVLRGAGARVATERAEVCPAFAVEGTFEEHLRKTKRRETLGRRARWFERQAGTVLDLVTDPGEAPGAMEDVLRLHQLRWAASGGSDGILAGPIENFHRTVAPLLAERGFLRIYRLSMRGQPIAAVYGLECGRRFYFYQSGYDPTFSARSPGLVVLGRTVEDAYERGLTDYNFLRGTEAYKLEWATDQRETCSLRIRAPTLRAGTVDAAKRVTRAARLAARTVAPEIIWSALRRARRRIWAGAVAFRARGGEDGG